MFSGTVSSSMRLHIHKLTIARTESQVQRGFCCSVNERLMGQAMQPGLARGCNSSLNKYTKTPHLQQVGSRKKKEKNKTAQLRLSTADFEKDAHKAQDQAKPRPPHLSKGNQSDQSGAVLWGWQARPGPGLSSPPASAVGFQITKEPRVSQRSVTSPAPR